MGLNGFLQMGYQGDWATHDIEHAVSAVYDIPHAGGLAILFPHWMRHNVKVNPDTICQACCQRIRCGSGREDGMKRLHMKELNVSRAFWTSIGAPETLADYDIDDSKIELMAEKATVNGPLGKFAIILNKEEVLSILKASL